MNEETVRVVCRRITRHDAGKYNIRLVNEFGEDQHEFTVAIKGKSPGTTHQPLHRRYGDDNVTVTWDKPASDGGATITGYLVEKKEVDRRVFKKVQQTSGSKNDCYADELESATKYLFRVAAVNKYGPSEYAEFPVFKTTGKEYVFEDEEEVVVPEEPKIEEERAKVEEPLAEEKLEEKPELVLPEIKAEEASKEKVEKPKEKKLKKKKAEEKVTEEKEQEPEDKAAEKTKSPEDKPDDENLKKKTAEEKVSKVKEPEKPMAEKPEEPEAKKRGKEEEQPKAPEKLVEKKIVKKKVTKKPVEKTPEEVTTEEVSMVKTEEKPITELEKPMAVPEKKVEEKTEVKEPVAEKAREVKEPEKPKEVEQVPDSKAKSPEEKAEEKKLKEKVEEQAPEVKVPEVKEPAKPKDEEKPKGAEEKPAEKKVVKKTVAKKPTEKKPEEEEVSEAKPAEEPAVPEEKSEAKEPEKLFEKKPKEKKLKKEVGEKISEEAPEAKKPSEALQDKAKSESPVEVLVPTEKPAIVKAKTTEEHVAGEETADFDFDIDSLRRRSTEESTVAAIEYKRATRHRQKRAGFVSLPTKEVFALRGDKVILEVELYNEEDQIELSTASLPLLTLESQLNLWTSCATSSSRTSFPRTPAWKLLSHWTSNNILRSSRDESPVEFVAKLDRKTTGDLDQDVKLVAELNHKSDVVEWSKNNEPIEASTHYEMTQENNKVMLTIKNAIYDDNGRYTVTAGDKVDSYTTLEIQGRPVIEKEECQPEPEVTCTFNGVAITADLRTKVDIYGETARLVSRQVTKADTGEYTVKLSNEFGEDTVTFKVDIKDTPAAPQNLHFSEVGHDCVTLHWEKPSHNGGATITAYVIEKKEADRRVFRKVAQTSGTKTHTYVDELEMETTYVFRVAAVNKFGHGVFAEFSEFTTGIPYTTPFMDNAPVISNVANNSCLLEWNKCYEDGRSPIYCYDVFYRKNDGEWVKANLEHVFVLHFTMENLEEEQKYEFKVEATNEAGLKSDSNVVSEALTIAKILEKPKIILPVPSIVITGVDSVTVDWDCPAELEAEENPIVSYTLQYKSEGNAVWTEVTVPQPPVHIDGLKEGVSYVFKVAANNKAGSGEYSEETSPIRVAAHEKPTITKAIKSTSISRKRELRLECHALGEPAPYYIWYKNGKEWIPENDDMEINNEGYMSVLQIHSVSDEDGGEYKCEVVNDHGIDECTAVITITDVRAHFTTSMPEQTEVLEGLNVVFRCEVSDEDAVVHWLKNGRPIPENERFQVEVKGVERKLTILDAKKGDSADYACETSDERSRAQGELVVKEEEPRIKIGPQDQIVDKFSSKVRLTCTSTKPPKTVKWYKNGQDLWEKFGKYSMYVEDDVIYLEIFDFDEKDVGEYKIALSDHDISAPAKLELKVPPKIELSKPLGQELVRNAETDLKIEFKYDGFPKPTVVMTIGDKPIKEIGIMDDFDGQVTVKVQGLKRITSGPIKIIAENEAGKDIVESYLKVLDVPAAPENLYATGVTSNSAKLAWDEPEETELPIEQYIIERKTAETSRWRQIGKVRSDRTSYEAIDLFSDEIYVFRVLAVNEVGKGVASNTVDVITLSEESERSESIKSKTPET
ncbi:hypothetical protein L596_021933 [Steinernema carpocapsae]|uniref:Uncharacterized protein n=1 Tax=Steinernema carpocapsae TaxID=34508 RepID=A0A4U5MKK8_STECR|nr:hypothetical protein L596_021933 [Steinernema carpocapsae]